MNSNIKIHAIAKQMEEQISDQLCTSLNRETDRLIGEYQDRPYAVTLLKMIQSIGRYLESRGDKSHPDALPVLKSITDAFESIMSQPDPETEEPPPLINEVMNQYRLLQNKLASKPDVQGRDIENLKEVILSVDWEISDQTLEDFEDETNRQLNRFRPYKIHYTLLRMIQSIGRYVAKHKADSHTDSINFLRTVFNAFEELVLNPDMSLDQKKEVLQRAIQQFEAFKQKLIPKPAPQKQEISEVDETPVAPALSHMKSTGGSGPDTDDFTPLDDLGDAPGPVSDNDDDDEVIPALSAQKGAANGSRDVMDDLFSVKESPADELLDAIHLLDVHGGGQDRALDMLDQSAGGGEGIKNFTPQKKETEPIPEIGSRLDEFFNLEPTDAPAAAETIPEATVAQQAVVENEPETDKENEETIPFDYEEDIETKITEPEAQVPADATESLLWMDSKLSSVLEENHSFEKEHLDEKIKLLRELWTQDKEKSMLIDLLAKALEIINKQPSASPPPSSSSDKKESKGFWAKLKGNFSS